MTEPTQKPGDPNKGSQLPANPAGGPHPTQPIAGQTPGTKPVEPPKAGQLPADKDKDKNKADREKEEKEKVRAHIEEILKAYNGKESDIPTNHEYWQLVNRQRAR
jgi:hypothetical protein